MAKKKTGLARTSLIILTLNEIDGLRATLPKLPLDEFGQVLLVDGGSKDGTVEFAQEQGIEVVRQTRKGRGDAFREGLAHATQDILVYFSPDGNEDAADIPRLVQGIEDGYDMVIATRFAKQSRSDDAGPVRRFGNWVFTTMINVFFNLRTTDAVNGFRAVRRDVMQRLQTDAMRFEIEIQMTMRCAKMGFKILEVPTYEMDRIGGESKVSSFWEGLRFTWIILKEAIV